MFIHVYNILMNWPLDFRWCVLGVRVLMVFKTLTLTTRYAKREERRKKKEEEKKGFFAEEEDRF